MLKKALGPKMVSCRICKGDHWTTKCPFKDTMKMDDGDDSKGIDMQKIVHCNLGQLFSTTFLNDLFQIPVGKLKYYRGIVNLREIKLCY